MHPVAASVVAAYLDAVDAEAPGLVEGLYLTGSAALGDFRPRTSDVDFVAVTARPLDDGALAALARAHARLRARHPRPFFDGLYATWADLAGDPALRRGPHSQEGRFHPESRGPGDPVTWHTVARYGVACRGPAPTDIAVSADPAALAAWTLDNLDRYWGRLLRGASRLSDRWGLGALAPYGAVWIVLGVARLHYTLATGALCSKTAAGEYALRAFPEARWQRVVAECLRIRRADRAGPGVSGALRASAADLLDLASARSLYRSPLARRRDVLAFGAMVTEDARARP
ncbi:MAG TPA: aminoglycoside adenylyltransferase domain-containing protein [Gemmatimonadaceae bacterium]|nr:aminoglycoside adenylyltransferase domain-containing protein [Gemmatimonadaceae bacterium]